MYRRLSDVDVGWQSSYTNVSTYMHICIDVYRRLSDFDTDCRST